MSALSKISGVKNVVATGERDMDSYAYVIESGKGMDVRKALFTLCSTKGWPILGLMPVGTDLETVFIRLVDRDSSEGKKEIDKSSRR